MPGPTVQLVEWFEIPAIDFDRAARFYGAVMQGPIVTRAMPPYTLGFLPTGDGVGSGAIVVGPDVKPSRDGVLLYLAAGPDPDAALARVRAAGGTVLQEKTAIAEYGFMARFEDSEGNVLALHSRG